MQHPTADATEPNPETIRLKVEAQRTKSFREKVSETTKKQWKLPHQRETIKKKIHERWKDPNESEKASELAIKRFKDPKERKRQSNIMKKISNDPTASMNKYEKFIGGFWYGNVRYPERKYYCEKWNRSFRERCRAFDGYKSILSDKSKEQNILNGRMYDLSVHHVYYQEKACCEWDEDMGGYFAMINIGTVKTPKMIRYDIKGDPNKFVTLTHSENILANTNKLEWINLFENIIEERGGKCYFTEGEMDEYLESTSQKPSNDNL